MTTPGTQPRNVHRLAALLLACLLVSGPARSARAEAEPLAPDAEAERVEREAAIRSSQLQLHQGLALATLAGMAVTAGLGLYTTHASAPEHHGLLRSAHMGLGGLTTGLYLSAATLAITAPQGYVLEREGVDAVTIHRNLAWLHAAALAGTVTLGLLSATGKVPSGTHGLAGGTTLGLLALSAGVIAFDF